METMTAKPTVQLNLRIPIALRAALERARTPPPDAKGQRPPKRKVSAVVISLLESWIASTPKPPAKRRRVAKRTRAAVRRRPAK